MKLREFLLDIRDYEVFLIFVVVSLICIAPYDVQWAAIFSCEAKKVTLCNYQTLMTGVFALVAACVTAYYIRKQIESGAKNHIRELRIGNLQFEHDLYYKNYSIASCIAAEILSLIKGVEDEQYVEDFLRQESYLQPVWTENNHVTAFSIHEDYFSAFSHLQSDLGLLNALLPEQVFCWYSDAKGIVDTVRSINAGDYKLRDQKEFAGEMAEQLTRVLADGRILVNKLKAEASASKMQAHAFRMQMSSLLLDD